MRTTNPLGKKFFITIAGLLGFVSLAGFFGHSHSFLDNFSHFRVQYCALFLALAVCFIFHRSFRAAVFSLALALVNGAEIHPYWFKSIDEATALSPAFRAVTMNLYSYNRNSEKIREFIEHTRPDFIFIEEFNKRLRSELQHTLNSYSYTQLSERDDGSGMGFLSQIEYEKAEVLYFDHNDIPFVSVKFNGSPSNLTLIGVHLDPPRNQKFFRYRNAQLAQLARRVNALPDSERVMVMGDLNTTPWSVHFKKFIDSTRLIDARRGRGILPSWPAYAFPFQIPIDHCLISKGVTLLDIQTGPDIGSDHYPLIIDFTL